MVLTLLQNEYDITSLYTITSSEQFFENEEREITYYPGLSVL